MSLLTYAMDRSQTLVHVDDVPKGLKCSCFCPIVGQSSTQRMAVLYESITSLMNMVLNAKVLMNH